MTKYKFTVTKKKPPYIKPYRFTVYAKEAFGWYEIFILDDGRMTKEGAIKAAKEKIEWLKEQAIPEEIIYEEEL